MPSNKRNALKRKKREIIDFHAPGEEGKRKEIPFLSPPRGRSSEKKG